MIDVKTSRLFACLYYLGIIFGAVILYFNRATTLPVAFILYGVLAIIMALNHCLFTESKMGKYIVAAELILASFVSYFDNSAFSGIYIVVIILYVIFFYEYRFSIPYTAVAVVCYIAALYIKSPSAALLVV